MTIDDRKVRAELHDGNVTKTRIDGKFDGCERGKLYPLENNLIFECNEHHYAYAHRPDVLIITVLGRRPVVIIDGRKYALDNNLFTTVCPSFVKTSAEILEQIL